MKICYLAEDGAVFENKEECLKHEKNLKSPVHYFGRGDIVVTLHQVPFSFEGERDLIDLECEDLLSEKGEIHMKNFGKFLQTCEECEIELQYYHTESLATDNGET